MRCLSACSDLDTVPNEGSTPVAPAFGTELSRLGLCGANSLEVGQKCLVRAHGDYASVLRPDLREQGEQDSAPLGGILLELPEAPEVLEQLTGPLDLGVVRRASRPAPSRS